MKIRVFNNCFIVEIYLYSFKSREDYQIKFFLNAQKEKVYLHICLEFAMKYQMRFKFCSIHFIVLSFFFLVQTVEIS